MLRLPSLVTFDEGFASVSSFSGVVGCEGRGSLLWWCPTTVWVCRRLPCLRRGRAWPDWAPASLRRFPASPRVQFVRILPSIPQQQLPEAAAAVTADPAGAQLGEVSTAIGKENAPLQDLMGDLAGLIWTTQQAAKSFLIERQQLLSQYFPRSPSVVMMTTVGRCQTNLIECCQMIENLIELVMKGDPTITYADALRAISAISSNIRDYMAYVLSQMIENFIELVMKDDPTINI